ncbi:UbiA family prenyltransferase [Flavobacterium sp. CYK-4]|uniref:geranylgeranylglycerol-phosphate geranylgeranyltransferase n=1 Tax=Flavobacterium lotistagni TaxID=2709660 RepID=UPI00140C1C14|nr:geranylgeranylglycerol-phosphate geranylgeranyltransferase [Flavobacterium lotistagni]NHM07717.1 UbiA family prenyltransferase [Flavobacterium lotistagni]
MSFFKLIRYQNLLMLALMQLIFRYGFLKWQNVPLSLADWQYILLVFSTVLIAAGGYVINDIFDQQTDAENKPQRVMIGQSISEATAYNIYVALNIVGVGIGFYLSNVIMKPGFATIFILIAALLYLYATSLKQTLLVGNVIVAMLLSFSVIIIGIFDLYPATYEGNQKEMAVLFSILLDYAIFAFIVNFIREIVKDLQDVNGDYNQGMSTLPIVLGVARTSKVVFALSFIPIAILLYYTNEYFAVSKLYLTMGYTLLFVVGPLLYFTIKLWTAKNTKDFGHLSNVLKLVLLFGILSIAIVAYNIKHHA